MSRRGKLLLQQEKIRKEYWRRTDKIRYGRLNVKRTKQLLKVPTTIALLILMKLK